MSLVRALGGGLASRSTTLRRVLMQRRVVLALPLLTALLCSGAVGSRYVFDDYVLGLVARGAPIDGLPSGRWDLFCFTTGAPAVNHKLMAQGLLLPWWSDERLKIAFYRPLSSLLHRLDYALWPNSPRCMYLHSLVWLGLLVALATCLYRRLEASRWVAGLAALLYAIDDGHGAVVAWLSNRNALIGSVFGLLSLLAHDLWRKHGHQGAAWLAAASLLLALSAGELAIGVLAYLVSYSLFLDRARPWRRVLALVPYAVVVAGWSVVHVHSGAGVRASGSYVSPWLEPARFAGVAPIRIAALLASTLGPVPAEALLLGRPEHLVYWAVIVGLVLTMAACAIWPLLRRDGTARFWMLGLLLSLIPVAASFPSDRLTLLASLGGMGVVARIVAPVFAASSAPGIGKRRMTLSVAFAIVHLALAPLSLPLRAAQMQLVGRALETGTRRFDDISQLEQRTVVILNAPLDAFASYIQAERAWHRLPRPQHLYWLTSAGSSIVVTRSDPSTLLVERDAGFFSSALERHYRDPPDTLARGEQVGFGPVLATVLGVTSDGRPRVVSFRFAEPLESSSYVFLLWKDGEYRSLSLATLAQPLQFPPEDLGRILLHTALGTLR